MATKDPPQIHNDKRKRITDSDSDTDPSVHADSWPRFLIIESTDPAKKLSQLSPFALDKAIQGIAGRPKAVKILRSGSVLLEVEKESHSKNLLKCRMLVDIPVNISRHRTLNTRRGVITSSELRTATEQEILENLAPQGVIETRRLKTKRDGQLKDTNSIILTFARPALPQKIKVAYLLLEVRPYVASPLRCFKCQKYGHHNKACHQAARCARCGSLEHPDGECRAPPRCINCEGDHPAFDKNCPVWKKEKLIQQIKAEKNVSYLEARKSLEISATRLPGPSTYAQAVTPKIKRESRGTQTDMSWPNNQENPTYIRTTREPEKITPNQPRPSTSSRVNDSSQTSPPRRNTSDRPSKGSNDPIKQYNKYGILSEEEDDNFSLNRGARPKQKILHIQKPIKNRKEQKEFENEPMELVLHPDNTDMDDLLTAMPDIEPTSPLLGNTSKTRKKIIPPK